MAHKKRPLQEDARTSAKRVADVSYPPLPNGPDLDAALVAIDQRRWPEARRRMEAIRRYIEGEDASMERVLEAAGSLDLSVNRFYALLRTWRLTGSVAAVTPFGEFTPRPPRRPKLDVLMVVSNAIAEAFQNNPAATAPEVAAHVELRCLEQGVVPRPPSNADHGRPGRVHNRRRARKLDPD